MNSIAKTTIFVASMDDFKVVNEVYGKYFTKTLPARSTVAIKTLPKNAKVEIEVVAFTGKPQESEGLFASWFNK
jgi:2-iminobutanoate/2-iminopropanoate deaminase